MPPLQSTARMFGRWVPALLCTGGLWAQTCLVLSPATVNSDGTASFDLSLYTSRETAPAAIQWTFQFVATSIISLAVADGPALDRSLKTAFCTGDTGIHKCVAAGLNRRTIVSGVIAKVTAELAPGATTGDIQISNAVAASPDGSTIRVVTFRPTIDPVSVDCRHHPQIRGSDNR